MITALAVGGVLLAVMIAASGYAAVTLPADTPIRLHFGSHEHFVLVSKRAGLVIWPAAGAAAYGVLGGVSASSLAAGWVPGVRDVLMPAVMCVMLGFQAGALVLARQHQDQDQEGVTEPAAGTGNLSAREIRGRPVALGVRVLVIAGRRHEDRQQSGQGDAGSAARRRRRPRPCAGVDRGGVPAVRVPADRDPGA